MSVSGCCIYVRVSSKGSRVKRVRWLGQAGLDKERLRYLRIASLSHIRYEARLERPYHPASNALDLARSEKRDLVT